jgi:8-oxo-dGTP pyrophosphatase MutT (NUDIX family)
MGSEDTVSVVAAVIDGGGRWLVGRRPERKRHGGLWEFPGGKVKPGESYLAAARRELDEELSLTAESAGRCVLSVRDPGSHFVIDFVEVVVSGDAQAHEHSEIGWFTLDELRSLPLAPADRTFVDWLTAQSD